MTKLGLTVENKQKLSITQNLQQNLKILQMSATELEQVVATELSANPFLSDENAEASEESFEELYDESYDSQQDLEDENFWSSTATPPRQHSVEGYSPLDHASSYESLQQHIEHQIEYAFTDARDKLTAQQLLNHLEDTGYLSENYLTLQDTLKCDEEYLDKVVQKMQNFTPSGIFARSLSECMKIQLNDLQLLCPELEAILYNLDLVALQNWKKLAKLCNSSIDEVRLLVSYFKTLNPKPGMQFSHETATIIIPELFVKLSPTKHIIIDANDRYLGRIQLKKEYYLDTKVQLRTKEDKKFCSQHYAQASQLVQAIAQRKNTLLKVTHAIAEKQISFFQYGIMQLQPMTLSDIASIVEMNESTISRTVNSKYISTEFGNLELKFFFSSKLSSKNNMEVSSTKVKELIRNMIAEEDLNNIQSDDEIAKMLSSAFNITIARRTVAKYREALRIPTSVARKRAYKNR